MINPELDFEWREPLQSNRFNGHALGRICKETLANSDDDALVERIQKAYPDYPLQLARTGHEWYRLGGVIKPDGSRIANDLNEWAERTFIECGQNFNTLLDYCEEESFLGTRHKGVTLYLVARTGSRAEDFVQIEVDKTQEVADRYLIDADRPPDDLEELIDPLNPLKVDPFAVGASRYTYRRKTEVALFMNELDQASGGPPSGATLHGRLERQQRRPASHFLQALERTPEPAQGQARRANHERGRGEEPKARCAQAGKPRSQEGQGALARADQPFRQPGRLSLRLVLLYGEGTGFAPCRRIGPPGFDEGLRLPAGTGHDRVEAMDRKALFAVASLKTHTHTTLHLGKT